MSKLKKFDKKYFRIVAISALVAAVSIFIYYEFTVLSAYLISTPGTATVILIFVSTLLFSLTSRRSGQDKSNKAQIKTINDNTNLKKYNEYLSKYASDMIFLFSIDGKILYANDKACKVYGYSLEEFLSMHIRDTRIESEKSLLEHHLLQINQHDKYLYETIHINKNGNTFPVEISSRLFEIDGEKFVQGSIRDISERKLAEESIRKSEIRFKSFADNIDDVIYIYRTKPKLHFDFVSPSVQKVLGYSPDEFYSDALLEMQIIHPDDAAYIFGNYDDNKQSKSQVLRYVHRDGHTVWMEQKRVMHFDNANNIQLIFSVARDVTERINTQNLLLESQQRYKSLAKFLPVGIYRADVDFNCLYVNEKWCEISGINSEQAVGKGWIEAVHPDDRKILWQKAEQLIQSESSVSQTEYRFVRPDGTFVWVLGDISAERNSNCDIIGYVGAITDITKNKKLEEDVHFQNLRYNTLLKTSVDGIHILDGDGNLIQANDAFCKLLGYDQDEILKLNVSDWNEYYSGEQFNDEIQAILLKPAIFESTMKRKNGTIIDAEISATGIYFNDQVMIFCSARDITERKKIQKQLTDSETKFRSLYELANDSILLIDPLTFRITDCNPSAVNLLERDKKLIIGKMPADLSPALQADGTISEVLSEHYLSKCTEDQFLRFEWQLNNSSNNRMNVEISLNKINMNSHGIIQAIIRDLSEKKKHEEEIRMLYNSIEQSPASIVITDTKGKIEYVNSKCLELTGYTKEEVIGNNPRMFQSGLTTTDNYKTLWNTVLDGEEWRGEFLNKKKNGDQYWETAIVSPVKNDAGEIIHLVGIKEDISSRKRVEEQLVLAKEKAEEMNRFKNAFLANISHELRTPLVGILGGATIINEETQNSELKTFSKMIIDGANRLNETINSLIEISQLEANTHQVLLEKINLVPIIKTNLYPFTPALETKKLKLNFKGYDEEIFVNADSQLIGKSISHLVNNAIKYTEKGEINLSLEKVNGSVIIKVADTGIGIPKTFNCGIFEPFRQASEGLARKYEGNGLGLAITKKYVELMKGEIWYESEVGVGSTFFLRLNRVEKTEELKKSIASEA